MLFLVLFATLAVGFTVATEMSAQIADNERQLALARMAADSGMEYIRYQLGSMVLANGTNSSNLLTNTATALGSEINGTTNMGSNTVQVTGGTDIYIPSQTGWMTLDPNLNTKFRADISQTGSNLVVTVHGAGSSASIVRGIQLQYTPSTGTSSVLNYGIAAMGPVDMTGNASIVGLNTTSQGSVLSATAGSTPLTMTGNVSMSGAFSDTNATGAITTAGNVSIGGSTSSPNFGGNVHKGITMPTFPTVDTSPYAPYATTQVTTTSGNFTITNGYIPANMNPTFSGNITIYGVLYINAPNKVKFSGNVTIQGAVVVANNPTGTSNSLTFAGNVSATTMDTLPNTFPAAERALTGSFLLAPDFAVTMSGNFGTIGGSLVADSFTFNGNAGGTIDGSIIALKDTAPSYGVSMSGNSPFYFGNSVTSTPAGLIFPGGYAPSEGSYIEVQ